MNRWPMIRRYLPLAAVVAIQLVIVAAVPSRSPGQIAASGSGGTDSSGFIDPLDGVDDGGQGLSGDGDGGDGGSGTSVRSGDRSTGGGAVGGSGGTTGPGGGSSAPPGDTSHCVNGRQADPAIYAHVPPCVPNFGGDNGGSTYIRGVSAEEIKVVVYRGNLGPAVDAILTAQGANASDEEFAAFMDAAFGWINQNYELYGRKITPVLVRGECPSVPPDYACLRNEARQIVDEHEPFLFVWNTSLASPFFDEFSALKVVNLGGWGFRDQFSQLRRPYHYDLQMGGSQLVDMVSEWYCKRMYGGGSAKAVHAGDPEFHGRNRVLGAISTDDPENKKSLDELNALLQQKCGTRIQHTYFYAQDITTAEQQKRAAVNEMRSDPESTTVMCFCDLVAPIFLYQESQEQEYFPEHIMVATGFMDADASAQAYGGLPSSNDDHEYGYNFHYAFGLAQLPDEEPVDNNHAARVWRAMGNSGAPYDDFYRWFEYYAMIGGLFQGAGPNLTPENIEAGAARMLVSAPGGNANAKLNIRGINPTSDYTWWDSLREIYWSTQQTSEFNGEPGTWVSLNDGRWFRRGEFPTGLIQVPKVPR